MAVPIPFIRILFSRVFKQSNSDRLAILGMVCRIIYLFSKMYPFASYNYQFLRLLINYKIISAKKLKFLQIRVWYASEEATWLEVNKWDSMLCIYYTHFYTHIKTSLQSSFQNCVQYSYRFSIKWTFLQYNVFMLEIVNWWYKL